MQNLHPIDIRGMVHKTGVSLSRLARQHGANPSTVRKSLYRPVPTGNRVIAAHLGRQLHELWPEWFDESGRRRISRPVNDTSAKRRAHRQKKGGA